MARPLTYKQRLFVHYYLNEAGGNATAAARLAGYAIPEEQGRRLVRKSTVSAEIEARLIHVGLTSDEILARIATIATADITDFLTFDDNGNFQVDLRKARRAGRSYLVKKVKITRQGVEIELHNPLDALEKLGRYHGLWKQANPLENWTDERILAVLSILAARTPAAGLAGGGDDSGQDEG